MLTTAELRKTKLLIVNHCDGFKSTKQLVNNIPALLARSPLRNYGLVEQPYTKVPHRRVLEDLNLPRHLTVIGRFVNQSV